METNLIVNEFLKHNYLINPDILETTFNFNEVLLSLNSYFQNEKPCVINKDILSDLLYFSNQEFDWNNFEKSRVLLEKGRETDSYFKYLKLINKENKNNINSNDNLVIKPNVRILTQYTKTDKKINLQDFVGYFKIRFKTLREILLKRQDLQDTISINKVLNKKDKETVSIIGILLSKNITKNDNFILELEDLTGIIKIIIGKNDKELYNNCKEIMLDETLGVIGSFSKGVLFGKKIIYPDVPLTKEFKKSPDEVYVVCTSDIHVGSRLFHKKEFENFTDWLNGNVGDENQAQIAKKVRYILITGDLVAGIGVYPNQDKDLYLKDINEQYKELARLLNKIRKDIFIILCPGDHDAVMVNEPQPPLDKEFAKEMYELENVYLVSNPCLVNIHSSENFSGFDFLLYHGHSFIYYADNIENIRGNGWTARGDLIMKYLLQRRHLSPTHSATTYVPESKFDPLVITEVPDFFVSGHLHQISNFVYRNVNLIGCGCWEALTPYQEKTGNKADPGKVTLINLKNREIKILNFVNQNKFLENDN